MQKTLVLNPSISIFQFLKLKLKLKTFWILGFVFILGLGIVYIFQVNEMAKQSYLLKNYEKKATELSQENKNLEIYFSQVNSLENMEKLVKKLNLEPLGKMHYIRILDKVASK